MKKVPFFAKYLETQTPTDEEAPKADLNGLKTGIKAGRPTVTVKYPSDRDEGVSTK